MVQHMQLLRNIINEKSGWVPVILSVVALLIRLLKILRQPTTGFALLGVHQRLTWNPAESPVCDVSRQLNVLHQAASCFSCYDIRDTTTHVTSFVREEGSHRFSGSEYYIHNTVTI
ncbi:hypothetical protein CSKR_113653 [Clonorchis sinensis]|uniref:Uncharacterized protein n=1 Tax=Clonorchis sinensis TaxID=79923 RepID=A0A3R7G957_CLOSI|nr:hypothetical protein CSKR_113653 [Clonorchis sinensis]